MARAIVVGLALIASAVHARADGNGFVWQAPSACPDGDSVRERIERRLGSRLEIHGVEVAITRTGNAFVAHLDTRGVTVANGARTLESTQCDDLADAVAVVVARLASDARFIHGDKEDPPDRVAAVLRPGDVHAESAAPNYDGGKSKWGAGVHLMGLSGVGTVPGVGLGGEASVFVRRRNAFAELGYARWNPSSAYLVTGAPGRVEVGLEAMTLRAGWSPANMPLRAWLGGEFGSMFGEGAALENTQAGSGPYFAATAGFGVGWPMSQNARLVGTFEVAVPVQAVHFALAESGDIYRSSPGAARCALGLELGWP